MLKKLVYFLYIDAYDTIEREMEKHPTLKLHFQNLKYHCNKFDEAVFVLSLKKDIMEHKQDIVKMYADFIISLGYINVRFKVEENDYFRECKALRDEVVESEDNKGKLVFFGHNKGTTNEYNESLIKLINSMYFYGLYEDEPEYYLITRECVYFGFPLLRVPDGVGKNPWENMPLYRYYFYGTFFWTNVSLLREHMFNGKREYPKCASRYYAENFPANTIEFDVVSSHKNVFTYSGRNLHYKFDDMFDEFCEVLGDKGEEVKNEFNDYCEMIKNIEL